MNRLLALLLALFVSPVLAADPAPPGHYPTGAKPSSPQVLASAPRFQRDGKIGAPAQFARVPDRISMWGNNRFGDCVTAEEAAAKIAAHPNVFVPESEVIDWARRNGVLNGATLSEVLDEMQVRGLLAEDGKRYQNGQKLLVDYRDRATLADAIFKGPVKIAVASGQIMDSLNRTSGKSGWAGTNWRTDNRTDHCVGLFGYGPADFLYTELAKKFPGVSRPASVGADEYGYLMFTWNSIGFVSEKSLQAVCREAWYRDPTTAGYPEPPHVDPVPPKPDPNDPNDPPTPEPQPVHPGRLTWWCIAGIAALVGLSLPYILAHYRKN